MFLVLQVGVRPRMKGDGGRAASLGEARKLNYSKKESLEEASGLKYLKAKDRAEKTDASKERVQQKAWIGKVAGAKKPCNDDEMWRNGGDDGESLKQLEKQVQALEKQLEDERKEQKKFVEVLTNVIKGEVPCVTLEKAENILVNFHQVALLL